MLRPLLFLILLGMIARPSLSRADESWEHPVYETGVYCELGGRSSPDIVGGELGIHVLDSEVLSMRCGLSFLASEELEDFFGGFSLGVRYNTETRVSAFVGMGVYAGYSKETVLADEDRIDNDDDGFVDEAGEEKDIVDNVLASIYPEAGVHLWISDRSRLTLSARYHVTTEGRENDFWLYSFGIAFFK